MRSVALANRAGLDEAQWPERLQAYLAEASEQDEEIAAHMAERFRLATPESFGFGLDCFIDGSPHGSRSVSAGALARELGPER